jgi:hypothetical protein
MSILIRACRWTRGLVLCALRLLLLRWHPQGWRSSISHKSGIGPGASGWYAVLRQRRGSSFDASVGGPTCLGHRSSRVCSSGESHSIYRRPRQLNRRSRSDQGIVWFAAGLSFAIVRVWGTAHEPCFGSAMAVNRVSAGGSWVRQRLYPRLQRSQRRWRHGTEYYRGNDPGHVEAG